MSEFEVVFQREKALAERGQRFFAMVVFIPQKDLESAQEGLAEILNERLRTSDTAGRLDGGHLAVVLPDTNEQGAFAMANAVMSQVAAAGLKFDFKVYVYPGDEGRPRPKDSSAGSGAETTGSATKGPSAPRGTGSLPSRDEVRAVHESSVLPTNANSLELRNLGEVRTTVDPPSAEDLRELCLQYISFRKRALDIVVAGSALVLLSPVFALVALVVKLTSPGPVFFTQKRAGQCAVPFNFYKFRSMYLDAEERKAALADQNEQSGPIFKMKNDPRMTPVGRFLRRSSLDELPQLYNVLVGEMTLVGPRPPTMTEVAEYEPWQLGRLRLRGGLTCIWQVNGRSEISDFDEWVRMDLRYAKERGLAMDLGILAKTPGAVLSGRGAF